MEKEYIEIIHTGSGILDEYRKLGPLHRCIIDKISELERTVGVHYVMCPPDEKIPDLPKDTHLRVGGGEWQVCVQLRAYYLRKAGYTNVVADKQISFSLEDACIDAGFAMT